MFPTSQSFFTQTKDDTQKVYLRGTVDDRVSFNEDNILKDSYSITAQSTDVTKVRIGTAFTKKLRLVIFNDLGIPRGQWQNKKISIEQGQVVDGILEWVPMGTFYVAKASHSIRGVDITAYDKMNNFDKPLDFTQTSGTPFDLLATACQTCGVELGQTATQIQAMPNGDSILGIEDPNNVPTYRDYIAYLAAMLGGFAEIYRDEKLYIRQYHQTADDEITPIERFESSTFSDFESYFSKITVISDGEEYIYDTGDEEGGLTMELGSNPFIQLGDEYTKNEHASAIAAAVANLHYTPFTSSVLSSPYYDLGDVIRFKDGLAENCLGCIQSITYKFGKVLIAGYGENPALQNDKSKYDKAIGTASKSGGSSIVYHTFVNSTPIEVSTTWTSLGILTFGTKSQTITEVWHEMIFDMSSSGEIELQYYYDGSPMAYSPRTKFDSAGDHLLGTQMWINTSGGSVHRWQVYARTKNGTAHVDAGDIHILLKGQGLSGSEGWNGLIDLSDEITLGMSLVNILSMTDEADLTLRGPENIGISDIRSLNLHLSNILPLSDSSILTAEAVRFKIQTENGKYLLQENGGKLKTEGVTR